MGTLRAGEENDSKNVAESETEKLATPSGFTLDETGKYSFHGVENAAYYLLYFCAPDAVNDEDSFLFSSAPIYDTGAEEYTGLCSEQFDYGYGRYLVKVFAFPELTDSVHAMSAAATNSFEYSGNQSAPEFYYYWNAFRKTMELELSNIKEYGFEAYPEEIRITFTDVNKADHVIEVSMKNISADQYTVTTDQLEVGKTYRVEASAFNSNEYVLNEWSETSVVSETLFLGESSVMVGNYAYSDGFPNDVFTFPRVCSNFDLNGGVAGNSIGLRGSLYESEYLFHAELTDTVEGDAYTYNLLMKGGFAGETGVGGSLHLKSDGTLLLAQDGIGPINTSEISGIWVENGDGTVTLSYNPDSIVMN